MIMQLTVLFNVFLELFLIHMVIIHVQPFVFLVIDFYYSNMRCNRRMNWVIVITCLTYLAFNFLYTKYSTKIYLPIDWETPKSYILTALAMMLSFVMFEGGHQVWKKWKEPRLKKKG